MQSNVLDLTKTLIGFDTTNPPGNELECLNHLGSILESAGFTVFLDSFSEGRASLAARLNPDASGASLCFGGHIDTVPFGSAAWATPPLSGEIRDGRIYGRGASDMKGGVAAMICTAVQLAGELPADRDLVVHVYGGEETGCRGSRHLVQTPALLGSPGAVVIAEPSSNRPLIGHKGALWLKATTTGRTAHGSMPEQGVNALSKMLNAAHGLQKFDFKETKHAHLGSPTMALTTLHSGLNINSIPDRAELTLDIRTVPDQSHGQLRDEIAECLGPEIELVPLLDLEPVWTDPENPWVKRVLALLRDRGRNPDQAGTVQFFTDAASIRAVLPDPPILIMGPGDPAMAHQTDEFCEIEELEQAVTLYLDIARDWYGRKSS